MTGVAVLSKRALAAAAFSLLACETLVGIALDFGAFR